LHPFDIFRPAKVKTIFWLVEPLGLGSPEVEDYKVDLHHVLAMELIIDPDLGKNQAIAALADWRIGA
jgi:hypothetical protein